MTNTAEHAKLITFRELFDSARLHSMEPRELLLQAARFERVEQTFLAEYGNAYVGKRIAVLASHSTQHFLGVLRLFLYGVGIAPHYYVGPYDGIVSNGLDTNSELYAFKPEVLLVFPAADDIKRYPPLFTHPESLDEWVATQAEPYLKLWDTFAKHNPDCQILHSLFVIPFVRQLGNLETNYAFSRTNCLRRLNDYLVQNRSSNLVLVDMEYFASFVGKDKWFDEVAFFVSKQPFSLNASKIVASYFSRALGTTIGNIKKCLVLDLDNTIWGGVIGDDGLSGINIDPTNPVGEAYLAFQRYLVTLLERGVLLAVCSKNEEDAAKLPFTNHPDMILKLDDFAAFVVNWDDKLTNLRRIAQQLNIGLDTFVFFDDSPAERALVREFEPKVEIIDVPDDPALYVRALEASFCFEWLQLSKEDVTRVDSYVQDRKRIELRNQLVDYDSYLHSLDMEAWVELTEEQSLPRVCQLINKTNQFNTRTRRYSESALRDMRDRPGEFSLVQIRLKDKFTNYGIISSLIVRIAGDSAFIENWVMSCRVFKRGLESVAINAAFALAKSRHCKWLIGEYIPTPKNGFVSKLYEELVFARFDNAAAKDFVEPKSIAYRAPVETFKQRDHHIRVHSLLT
ncbi:MAG: HAD-IIIC family phosphatase [Burkholderiales bacterium]